MRIKSLFILFLTTFLVLNVSTVSYAQEEDDEDEEFLDDPPEEIYDGPQDNPPPPGFDPSVRTPPTPKGFNPPDRGRNTNQNFRSGISTSGEASSGSVEFRLVDPPKFYKKKKRPSLKPPANSKNI